MTSRPPLPHRPRAWLLGVVVPALITAAAWLAILALLPRVPDPAAVHWGLSGVDRAGSTAELLVTMGATSGLSLVVMAVLAVRTGRQALTRRTTLALAVALATLFAGATLGTVVVQLDAPTAAAAGSPEGWIVGALVLAVVLGAVAGTLAGADPAMPATGAAAGGATTADLPEGQRAVWITSVAGLGERTTGLLLAGGVVVAVGLWLLTQSLVPLVVLVPLLLVLLVMTTWQVQVDHRGLTARSTFGWPRLSVPAGEVERADVTRVSPLREFGGWGLRTSTAGTVGVVIRAGEAIAVERSGGRRLVVTVDDAATGAALLNTYAARSRQGLDR
ncbi:DUF1648 domain-containing protein [Georgenia sp. MJ170]|uniref:DUF1648 domain-containing protein n=1 Tax=Georgenia sunbinii TaxID=3117728 RepID=UPI002F262EB7